MLLYGAVMTTRYRPPVRRASRITVIPQNLDSPRYQVTIERAEQLLASGRAERIPGLNSIKEKGLKPRGELREWRKTPCYDPETGVSMPTMQLVEPEDRRAFGRVPSRPNNASNRKRLRMSPQKHPFPANSPSPKV